MATVAPCDVQGPAPSPAMRIAASLARFLVQLQADGRSPHTIAQYERHVRRFAAAFTPRPGASASAPA